MRYQVCPICLKFYTLYQNKTHKSSQENQKNWSYNDFLRSFGKYYFYMKQKYRRNSFFSKQIGCINGIVGYIGDGYCDDENNNAGCHFDGGDCCGVNVNTQYCNLCTCYQ